MASRYVLLGLGIAVAIVLGLLFWPSDDPEPEPPQAPEPVAKPISAAPPVPARPAVAPAPVSPPPIPVDPADLPPPPLNDSDGWVREKLTNAAIPWLAETELVRTFATVLENASRGEVPRNLLGFMAPRGGFDVQQRGGITRPTSSSYSRYDSYVQALLSIPPEQAVTLFRSADGMLTEALRELGISDPEPLAMLVDAAAQINGTPVLEQAPALAQPKVMYTYADAELERLSPLQKQLLRMGPDNVRMTQAWLDEFLNAFR